MVKINILSIMSAFLPVLKYTLILYCMPIFYYLFKSLCLDSSLNQLQVPPNILVSTDAVLSVRNCFPFIVNLSNPFLFILYSSTEISPSLLCLSWSLQLELITSFLVSPKHHVYNSTISLIQWWFINKFKYVSIREKIVSFNFVSPMVSLMLNTNVDIQ